MGYHQNARFTVHGREQMSRFVAERCCTLKATAAAFNVSAKTEGTPASWRGRAGWLLHTKPAPGGSTPPASRTEAPPEARLDIPDRRFDLALGLGPIRMTDPGHEAVVAGEIQHLRMKAGLPFDAVEDHRFHVVGQHRCRHTAGKVESVHHAVQQRRLVLTVPVVTLQNQRRLLWNDLRLIELHPCVANFVVQTLHQHLDGGHAAVALHRGQDGLDLVGAYPRVRQRGIALRNAGPGGPGRKLDHRDHGAGALKADALRIAEADMEKAAPSNGDSSSWTAWVAAVWADNGAASSMTARERRRANLFGMNGLPNWLC